MSDQRVEYVCPSCGSEEIVREAVVNWDATSQTWVVGTLYDDCICTQCDREIRVDAVERVLSEA
jgi:predicted RNA-binding Zn-ribbon protein involved in translation (DUF1610 family)